MQFYIDNNVLGLQSVDDNFVWGNYNGPFQGVASNAVGSGLSGIIKDAANNNAGWRGIGTDISIGIPASSAGQIVYDAMPQHWGNANTAQQAAGPNFGSALAQQLITGF
jgi:hypothetical protein